MGQSSFAPKGTTLTSNPQKSGLVVELKKEAKNKKEIYDIFIF